MPIPPAALAEIEALGRTLRDHPMETSALDPRDYALDACRRFMARVRETLDHGVGFAILDHLPIDAFDKDELKKIYWLLSGMIGRPVAQSYDGRLLYDVLDTGARIDTRVRGDLTRQELSWHTDYGFNFPPPHIGLLVLSTAREGGTSSVASMLAIHNVLRARHPALFRRLYEPFCWNRQGEHAEGDAVVHRFPVFSYDGREVRGRFIKWLLYRGYELAGEPFDRTGRDAIETMFDIDERAGPPRIVFPGSRPDPVSEQFSNCPSPHRVRGRDGRPRGSPAPGEDLPAGRGQTELHGVAASRGVLPGRSPLPAVRRLPNAAKAAATLERGRAVSPDAGAPRRRSRPPPASSCAGTRRRRNPRSGRSRAAPRRREGGRTRATRGQSPSAARHTRTARGWRRR